MTAAGDMLYIFGGQVPDRHNTKESVQHILKHCPVSCCQPCSVMQVHCARDTLQDPVTGSCYNDIIMMDSRSWQWMALEVCLGLPITRCLAKSIAAAANSASVMLLCFLMMQQLACSTCP